MKTLVIIRHAKSSWNNPLEPDFDRPLNERGKRDAPRMGKRLKEKGLTPQLMLSSPAKRALSTCKKIAHEIGYPEGSIKADKALYHADDDEILDIVHQLGDKLDVVFIFGHNPGLTNFVNLVLDDSLVNIPTCGIVAGQFKVDSWKEIDRSNATMLFFDFPKSKED